MARMLNSLDRNPPPPPFSRIFIHEGDIEYTGCGNTAEHTGLKARAPPWLYVATLQRQNAENLKQILNSQKRNIGASVPISTFMCLWANYIFPRWVCLFCWRKYVDQSWEYISRSQTHECGNWGWDCAIPRKGIYKRNCRCSASCPGELEERCEGTCFANVLPRFEQKLSAASYCQLQQYL